MPFPELGARIAIVRARIQLAADRGGHGQAVTIVAVTKTHGPDAVLAAWDAGIRDAGENRVQEALAKMPDVSVPVRWHLIGHLQRNKVKSLDRFSMFHALDSSRLADSVNAFGDERAQPVSCLVQVNAAREGTKGGFYIEELAAESARLATMKGVRVKGVMTIGRLDADESELRRTFGLAREARDTLAGDGHPATELSMGMSGDYDIAVEEGATIVRLGTTLFGSRE
ncbi:MAG: YggS family pyridoxal phosphate-dependent enzyme [Gemmatimonadaceae bacterium]